MVYFSRIKCTVLGGYVNNTMGGILGNLINLTDQNIHVQTHQNSRKLGFSQTHIECAKLRAYLVHNFINRHRSGETDRQTDTRTIRQDKDKQTDS